MDYTMSALKFLISVFLLLEGCHLTDGEPTCGFPGSPAYGYVNPNKDSYKDGEAVTYSCRVGYILLGVPVSKCQTDGSWTEDIPICDDSMTTLGVAFSSPTVPGHPQEMAIDGNRESCTYLKARKPRWWRIDLGGLHKILSVAVTRISTDEFVKFTVFVIQAHGQDTSYDASYKICASFSGKFGSTTVVFNCAEGKGIEGQKVHIEDHRPMDGLFEICEVEVQVEKDTGYDCGRPDRGLFSINYEPRDNEVNYGCVTGYKIKGQATRQCESTGQWSGEAPICIPVVCESIEPVEHGEVTLSVIAEETPLEGTVAVYKCEEAYKLKGDVTRRCLKDGSWSGMTPRCEAIRCPVLEGRNPGEVYRLLNKTTRMGNMAELKCKRGSKREGENPYIYCTEDGVWTKPEAFCTLLARASMSMKEEPRIAKRGGVIFGMVVAAIMMLTIAITFIIIKRRRDANKPVLPSRQNEPLVPPPRPPPRAKGIKSTIIDFMHREPSGPKSEILDDKTNERPAWKTRSLPIEPELTNSSNDANAAKRALSYDGAKTLLHEKKADSGQNASGVYATVPEETDNQIKNESENRNESSEETGSPAQTANGEYAAFDYEKKRQSRLMKDQSSEEAMPSTPSEMEDIPLRDLPPIPTEEIENEPQNITANEEGTTLIKNDGEKKDQDEEEGGSEESEDVSLPIIQSDSPTSGNATPSPDVVIENQVDGIPESSSTSTPEDRATRRRTRGLAAEQPSTEDAPESRRIRRPQEREETEEQERSSAPTPVAEQRPARRRPFGAERFESTKTSQPFVRKR